MSCPGSCFLEDWTDPPDPLGEGGFQFLAYRKKKSGFPLLRGAHELNMTLLPLFVRTPLGVRGVHVSAESRWFSSNCWRNAIVAEPRGGWKWVRALFWLIAEVFVEFSEMFHLNNGCNQQICCTVRTASMDQYCTWWSANYQRCGKSAPSCPQRCLMQRVNLTFYTNFTSGLQERNALNSLEKQEELLVITCAWLY